MTAEGSSHAGPHRPARRLYAGVWRGVVQLLRVPEAPPHLPGAAATVDSLRPAAAFLKYLKLWFWIATLCIDALLLVAWIAITVWKWWLGLLLLPPFLALMVVPDIIIYIALHLRFDTTWYVISDESLRIRRGVWVIREMTVTFENVQNLKLTQGPVQRLFGISNLHVETAGGGSSSDRGKQGFHVGHEAIIEGVSNAPALRKRILARLRRSGGAGLGDEAHAGGWTEAHLTALREVLDAARSLRNG